MKRVITDRYGMIASYDVVAALIRAEALRREADARERERDARRLARAQLWRRRLAGLRTQLRIRRETPELAV